MMHAKPHNILVIRLSSLGDILLLTPMLRLLRTAYPHACIEVLLKAEYQALLQCHPGITRLRLWHPQQSLRQALSELRQTRYDLVLDMHRTLRSRLLLYGLRAQRKLAYHKHRLRRALLVHCGWNTLQAMTPVPQWYAAPLRQLGITAPLPALEMHLDPDSCQAMRAYRMQALADEAPRPLLAIAPGARWATKRWPAERFAAVAQELAQDQPMAVVILGGAEDVALAQDICQRLQLPVLNSTGKLSLMHTAALLQQCRLLLSNDSGLMHMATALGVPVVAIFGPTVQEFGFYPFQVQAQAQVVHSSLACRPCSTKGSARCPKGHHRCMLDIPSAQVLAVARKLWGANAT